MVIVMGNAANGRSSASPESSCSCARRSISFTSLLIEQDETAAGGRCVDRFLTLFETKGHRVAERCGRGAQKVNRMKMFRDILAHRGSLRTGEYEVQNELRCVFKCSLAPNGGKQRSFKNR